MNDAGNSRPFPLDSLRWLPYGRRRKYRHLSRFDRQCWESFMDSHPGYFHNVAYDVPVGRGVTVTDDPDVQYQKMVSALTMHRIDVVGTSSNDVHICEIKPGFSPAAIGQLLTYRSMFYDTFGRDFAVVLTVIYFTGSEDAFLCAREAGVHTLLAGTRIPDRSYQHVNKY